MKLGLVLLWMGTAAALGARKMWRHRALVRRLRRVPGRRISDIREGEDVRLCGTVGRAEDRTPLIAPISGRACIAWRVRVEKRSRHEIAAEPWRLVAERHDSTPAVLNDGSGTAVFGGTARWALQVDARGGAGLWYDLRAPEAAGARRLLSELGVPTEAADWDHDVRIEEGVLAVGDQAVVAGSGRWESAAQLGSGSYREASRLLRLLPMSSGELIVTNEPVLIRRFR